MTNKKLTKGVPARGFAPSTTKTRPDTAPTPPSAKDSLAKQQLYNKLLDKLLDSFGIRATDQLKRKVERTFSKTPVPTLTGWVNDMLAQDAKHPDWIGFVETLTVHETYFHRDLPQLQVLHETVLPSIVNSIAQQSRPKLKIWSAACSTGEEAYTITMMLLDVMLKAGYATGNTKSGVKINPKWKVEILASDVSRRALKRAAAALYTDQGLGSFRDMPAKWKEFFTPAAPPAESTIIGATYLTPKPWLKQLVKFQQYNLLDEAIPSRNDFDLIFCRNVLIYFDDPARKHVQQNFHKALHKGGTLFLGPTDRMLKPNLYETQWAGQRVYYISK